ncbi:hypothetical protein VNO80_10868 [Phaseolus coccineus]|uniref:Uncharacterized protein n=1 Tax=Phaseolus coccineus TaxID=3886 RepID=A0AAN9RE82_PHACN
MDSNVICKRSNLPASSQGKGWHNHNASLSGSLEGLQCLLCILENALGLESFLAAEVSHRIVFLLLSTGLNRWSCEVLNGFGDRGLELLVYLLLGAIIKVRNRTALLLMKQNRFVVFCEPKMSLMENAAWSYANGAASTLSKVQSFCIVDP